MTRLHACALPLAAMFAFGCVDSSGLGAGEELDAGLDSSVTAESGADSEPPDTNVELPDTSDTAEPDTNVPDTAMPETCALTICGGACVDTNTSFDNCGKCGTKCADAVKFSVGCAAGSCTCAAGETKCMTACTVTRDDSNACSACNTACGKDKYCSAGACVCRPGLTLCGTSCVDLAGDVSNCGSCGNRCGGGSTCSAGMCGKLTCPTGRIACDGGGGTSSCFDTMRDPTHCGDCNKACSHEQLCIAGVCRKYAPAAGCATCGGCATCTTLFASGRCCPALPGHSAPSCVDGPACPG